MAASKLYVCLILWLYFRTQFGLSLILVCSNLLNTGTSSLDDAYCVVLGAALRAFGRVDVVQLQSALLLSAFSTSVRLLFIFCSVRFIHHTKMC
jgi:hypothetical protein